MKTNLSKVNKNQIKAVIELDRDDLQKYINKSEELLGGELEVKGFRKGKVPRELFKQHLDQEKVRTFALETAVEDSLSDVIKENSLDVLETSQLSVIKNDADRLEYSVLLDIFPEIKLANLDGIKIKRRDVKVEDKEMEDALDVVKNSRSNFINKEDGETAEQGDRVEIDFEVKKDGQVIEGGVSKNHPLIIGGRNFIPGFEDQLVGMKKGENKSFALTAPADYFYKDLAGKKLDFEVRLNDIKKVVKPEINDDFARTLGNFGNLAELKANIMSGLVQEKRVKENQKLRLEALDAIIAGSSIDVPENLVNNQLDIMVSDFDQTLHEKGLELGLYLARIGKTQEELKKDWRKDAEKQVKVSLVLRRIIKDQKIRASQEEVETAFNEVIQSAMASGDVNLNDIDHLKVKENVASKIINEKALGYIDSMCIV